MFPGLSNKDRGRGERQIGFPSLPSFPALLRSPHSGPTPGSIFVPNRINPRQFSPQSERWAGNKDFCVLSDTRRRVGGKVSRFLKIKLEYGFVLGNIYYYPSFSAFAPFCAYKYIAFVILTQYLTHAI